ncbi:unnamed protein product [Amoebophrya sp. A25]|nr:unnamed protein product [Amoebophrya sp. A25]|eukprot:GSA25T00007639001.1
MGVALLRCRENQVCSYHKQEGLARDSTVVLPRESSAIIPGPSEAKGGGGSAGEGSGQIIRESTVVLPRGFSTIIPRPSGLQQVDEGRTFPTSAVEALRRTAESRVNQRQVFQADQDASPDRRISSDGGQREDVRNYKSTSKTSIATRGVSAFSGGGDRADYSYYSRGSGSTAGSLVRNVNDRVEELLQEIGVTLGVPSSAQAHPGENIPFTNHVHEPPQLGSVVCNPEGRKSKSPGSDLQDIFVSRPSDYVLQPSDYVRSSTRYASTSKGQQLDAPQLGQVRDQDRDNAGSVFPPGVHASSSPSFSTTAQPHNMVPSAGTVASTDPRSVVVPVEQRADAKKRTSSLHPQHEAGGSSSSVISQDLAAAHKMKGEQQPAYALQLSGPLREVDQQPSQQPRTVIEEPVSPMSTARSGWQWEPAYILRRWSPGGTSSGDFRIVSATTGGLVTHPGFLETHFPSALPVFARDEDDDVLAAPSLQPERFVHQQMASVAQRKGDRLSGNASTAQSKTCVNSAATSLMSPIPRSLQQARDAVKSSRAPAAGGGSSEDVASGIGSIQQESAVEADAVPVVDHYTIHERGGDAATQNIVFNMNRVRPRTSDRDDVQDRLFSPRRREDHLSSRMTASAAARMKSTAMRQEQRRETSNDSARGKRVAPTWSNSTKVMTGVINSHTPMPIGGTSPRGSSRSGQEEGGLSNSNGGGFTPRQQRSLAVQLELEKRRSLLRERRESRGAEANAKASSKRQNARRNGRNLPSSRRPAGSGPTSSTVSAVFNTGTNKPSSTRRKDRNAREGTNALSEITSQQPMTTASTILMKGGAASSAAPPNNRMERGGTRQLAEEEINQGQRQEAQRGDGTQGAGIISMSLPAERPMSKQSIERPPAAKGYSAPAAEFRKFELEKLHPLPHTIAQKSQTQKLSKQDRPVAEHNIDDMERIPIANTSGSGLTPDEKQVASTGNAGDPNYDVLDQLQKTPFDGRVIIRRSRKEVSPNKIRSTARITAAPVMVMKNTSSPSIRSVELSGDEMQRPPHASKSAVTEADDHRLGEGSHKKPHAEKTVAAARLEEDLRDAAAYMFPNRSQREGQHAGAAEEDPGAFLDAELPGASPQTELPFSPPAIVIDSPEHQTMKLEPPLELATHNQKLVPQEELSWRKQGEAKEQRQNPSTNYNFYPEKILESHMRLLDLLDVAARDEVQQIEARIDDHAVANTAHHARRFNSTTKAKNRNRGRSPSENELRAKLGGRGSGSQLLASQDPAVSGAPTAAESLAASDATVPSLLVGDPVLQQEWHNLVKEVHALQASCSVTAPDPAPAAQLPSNQLRSISKTSSRDDTTIGAPSSSKRGRSRSRCTKSTASRFPPGRFIPLGEMKA